MVLESGLLQDLSHVTYTVSEYNELEIQGATRPSF